jgi:hypothetical protein
MKFAVYYPDLDDEDPVDVVDTREEAERRAEAYRDAADTNDLPIPRITVREVPDTVENRSWPG